MKRMLFNATQAEELRVAIVDGQKLIDLDIESASKEQRKSNIYKAVITRIEPSLEAAFVDYGAERHGFLPFKEISRSYFKSGVEAGKARIQDVLSTGQELIVQVEKDERGNKGAALTTFVSLAGRYLVLMPNNPRGGGVSRRVEGDERQELREVMDQLDVPNGTSLIARTAGIGRNAEELQWDLNYLMQLWTAIEGAAKGQSGAFLIYQESSLVIRAIRDYFHAEIGEILIDTDDVFEQAQQFMAHVMPGNVARVKRYHDDVPLFSRFQIEHQIESAYSRQVTLPSGGAIVIDHTEALVSVDVNSGRATKGSDIEETAFRTNCEAADEIARQLRLRDLGGLIVIDFIDMESSKNQREVENRLRDALHFDRARVQTGKISRFGLLELSRQRLRPALAETSYITCPRCTGTGHIRSTESAALHILRILEEESMKENTGALHCQVPVDVGTFLLNEKRVDIAKIEVRHRINLMIIPNRHLETPQHEIVRLRHDQLNQEGITLASYQMVEKAEKASEENTYQPPSAQTEGKAAKQEAAVKGITPDQPAPVVEPKVAPMAKAEAGPGLFSRIVAFFTGGSQEEPAAAPKAESKPVRRDRGGDRDRNNRDRGGRNNRDRGGRDNREGREEKSGRSGGERNEPRTQQPKREPASEGGEGQSDNRRRQRGERKERGERGGQSQRPDAAPVAAATEAAPVLTTPPADAAAAPGEGQSDNRRRRGRGGRGRGERRPDEATGSTAPADAAAVVAMVETPSPEIATAPTLAVIETVVDVAPQAPAEVAVEPAIAVTPPPTFAVAPAPAPVEAPAVSAVLAPPPSEPVPEVIEEPAPLPVVEAAPVAISAPAAAPAITAAPVAPVVDMSASLEQAGLVLIETAPAQRAAEPIVVPQPQLGRKPKPVVAVASEPLQMVETKHD
ncbi:MAG: Rne/Rng family ribonuclease [Gammaproteobacteria bacterium]|nr:Rne/Rng family ribonuclease [Gammaproteobacteria bacterium]MBU1646573.1 Rne/Rng family ribonuclease [Gammaproteobacteria bacterium]MBU1972830.1 Rne/Rng family ribonuclease [Gammaproteobacteria bacterium]